MNMNTSTVHLELDELQRMLDNQCERTERAYLAAHLRTCNRCAEEMRVLEHQAALISQWMQRADFEDVRNGHAEVQTEPDVLTHWKFNGGRASNHALNQGWLRAAAVLALLATPVAASTAVREWIAERIGVRNEVPVVATAADPELMPAPQAMGVIRFSPAAGSFDVVFASIQTEGTLSLIGGDAPDAALEITGSSGAGPVVAEHELRINNDDRSTASYSLRMPPKVTRVVVRIPGHPVRIVEALQLREGVHIPLAQ